MDTLPGIDHIYIVHHPLAARRRAAMDAWIAHERFAPSYIEYRSRHLAETLPQETIDRYYLPDPVEHARRAGAVSEGRSHHPHFPLDRREIAATIEHLDIFGDCIEKKYSRILILEDDALFVSDFSDRIGALMTQHLPSDADIISLGDGCGSHINQPPYAIATRSDILLYENPKHHMRCTDSYIITREACERLLPSIVPFALAIDWEMSYQCIRLALHVYWAEPTLVTQGSFVGRYPSLLR